MPSHWSPYVGVAELDALLQRLPALGGRVVVPPVTIDALARVALIEDAVGALLGLWQTVPTARGTCVQRRASQGPPRHEGRPCGRRSSLPITSTGTARGTSMAPSKSPFAMNGATVCSSCAWTARRCCIGPAASASTAAGSRRAIIDIRITGLPSAVSASDTSSSASLSVLGSARDDALTIGRAADGVLRVNGGAVPVAGGPATVASRRLM